MAQGMTRRRLTLVALAVFATHALIRAQTPPPAADERGPLERQAIPITATNPIPERVSLVFPTYPAGTDRADGTVTLRITVDASGTVVEARQPFRPDMSMIPLENNGVQPAPPLGAAFVKAALEAVRAWKYVPPAQAPISFYVRLRFSPDRPSSVIWQDARPPVTVNTMTATGTVPGGVIGGLPSGVAAGAPGAVAPPPPPPPPPAAPIRVGVNMSVPKKVKDVKPVYPPDAMANRVEGLVILEATIATDGRVTNARVLRSIPALDQAALDAVRQWEFTPTLLNGQPVPIIMSVTVNFTLARPAGSAPAAPPTK